MQSAPFSSLEFQALVREMLQGFVDDWREHRRANPELFTDKMSAEQWWESFMEFASADIANRPLIGGEP